MENSNYYCLVCFDGIVKSPVNEFEANLSFSDLFDTFWKTFEINLPKKYFPFWNFSAEPLPFCEKCYQNFILPIYELQFELKWLQKKLKLQIETVQTTIRNSRRNPGHSESDKLRKKNNERIEILRDLITGPFIELHRSLDIDSEHRSFTQEGSFSERKTRKKTRFHPDPDIILVEDDENNDDETKSSAFLSNDEGDESDYVIENYEDDSHQTDSDYEPEESVSKSKSRSRGKSKVKVENETSEEGKEKDDKLSSQGKRRHRRRSYLGEPKLTMLGFPRKRRGNRKPAKLVKHVRDNIFSYDGFEYTQIDEQCFQCNGCTDIKVRTKQGMINHMRIIHLGEPPGKKRYEDDDPPEVREKKRALLNAIGRKRGKEKRRQLQEQKVQEAMKRGETYRPRKEPITSRKITQVSDTTFLYAGVQFAKIDTEEDKFIQCGQCPVSVKTMGGMFNHIRIHHLGELKPEILCDLCGRGFASDPALRRHQLSHKEVRDHVCDICGRGYKAADHLRSHIQQVHSQQTPVLCQFCGRSFGRKTLVNIHIRRFHLKELNYPCPEPGCGKKFFSSYHLSVHKDSHSTHNKHQCPEENCHVSVRNREALRKHLQSAHGIIKWYSHKNNSQGNRSISNSSSSKSISMETSTTTTTSPNVQDANSEDACGTSYDSLQMAKEFLDMGNVFKYQEL